MALKDLVLSAGGNAVAGEVGEEAFKLLLAGEGGRHFGEGGRVAAEPVDVSLLGGESLVLAADDFPQFLDCS
jgi:hypothetical protein